jgi:hypothetical protein
MPSAQGLFLDGWGAQIGIVWQSILKNFLSIRGTELFPTMLIVVTIAN